MRACVWRACVRARARMCVCVRVRVRFGAGVCQWKAGDVCLQTHGGYGFATEFDIERKWREARLYRVAPISTNLIMSFVAEKVLGLPRSY